MSATIGVKKQRILVTAGPTREKIDPVRFISNYSTGAFGYAIAREAKRRGHPVTLISGPTSLDRPKGIKFIRVEDAQGMRKAVLSAFTGSDCIIMAAAISDWRPKASARRKIKKGTREPELRLVRNPDILKELGKKKGGRILAGFALETESLYKNAVKKLKEKKLDIIIANKLSPGKSVFGDERTSILIVDRLGKTRKISGKFKKGLAKIILDKVLSFNI